MGSFGMPTNGLNIGSKYIEDDYVASGYFLAGDIIEAIFINDSFRYDKRIDGLYSCQTDIIEII